MRVFRKRLITTLCIVIALLTLASPAQALTVVPEVELPAGAVGDEVQLLQDNLVELSLLDAMSADGEYNANTVIAVHKLQAMLGLPTDGQFSRETAAALNVYIRKTTAAPKPLKGYKIGIDPGHQKTPDTKYEAVAPGSERTKERMSAGCVGVKSGVNEYVITLIVSNKLKRLFESAGAVVVMSRSTHDISLSNAERAQRMNREGVDFWVRLHCDYANSRDTHGAYVLTPAKSAAPGIAAASLELSKAVLTGFCGVTGAKRNAVLVRNDQTGMNWSNSPVVTLEMGYLSNPNEDALLNKDSYQALCAQGVYEGVLAYAKAYPKAAAADENV